MKIPFVDLKAQYNSIKEEIDSAIQKVILESAFIGGKFGESFEKAFANYLGVKNCVAVGNGTDAIFIALKCLGLKEGDEVITVANSFIATSEAITLTGARVVFVDCRPDTYNIDPEKIEKAITPRTRAIVPVHLYGQPAAMDEIMALARRYDLRVVEDVCQAHGALSDGKKSGTFGDVGCFSFFPGKNLGAYGDAGAAVTNDDDLAKKIRMFANHGRVEKYNHEFEGTNSRLDGLQAAILEVKLKHLEKWTERRRAVARVYDAALKDLVVIPQVLKNVRHVYHLYVIQLTDRDEVRKQLSAAGIDTGIHYPIPLPFLKAYNYLGHQVGDFPVANNLKDKILSLPISGDITDVQVNYVVQNLLEFLPKK